RNWPRSRPDTPSGFAVADRVWLRAIPGIERPQQRSRTPGLAPPPARRAPAVAPFSSRVRPWPATLAVSRDRRRDGTRPEGRPPAPAPGRQAFARLAEPVAVSRSRSRAAPPGRGPPRRVLPPPSRPPPAAPRPTAPTSPARACSAARTCVADTQPTAAPPAPA